MLRGALFETTDHLLSQGNHVHRLESPQDKVHFLQKEDVVDQRGNLLDVLMDDGEDTFDLFGGDVAVLQELQVTVDAGQRRSQVVAMLVRNSRRRNPSSASF